METNDTIQTIPILGVAWRRYAQLDARSATISRNRYRLRRLVVLVGIIAMLLAILAEAYGEEMYALVVLRFFLVLTPITLSVIAAFANRIYQNGSWLIMRAGAEEIQKDIYFYRTILKESTDRREWLKNRLATIQRHINNSLEGELTLKPYEGKLPPYHSPDDPNSDPGFSDLTGEEYFSYRLQRQLAYHIKKVNQSQREGMRLRITILAMGGVGAVLATLGGTLTVWVALMASIAVALTGWDELRNLDAIVKNNNGVIGELIILHDYWKNLEPEERTEGEFFRIVKSTEDILWCQYERYIQALPVALAAVNNKDIEVVESMVRLAHEADMASERQMRESLLDQVELQIEAKVDSLMEPHLEVMDAFVEEASYETLHSDQQSVGKAVGERTVSFGDALREIAEEYEGLEITKETPKEELNELLSKYPTTGDVKG